MERKCARTLVCACVCACVRMSVSLSQYIGPFAPHFFFFFPPPFFFPHPFSFFGALGFAASSNSCRAFSKFSLSRQMCAPSGALRYLQPCTSVSKAETYPQGSHFTASLLLLACAAVVTGNRSPCDRMTRAELYANMQSNHAPLLLKFLAALWAQRRLKASRKQPPHLCCVWWR